MIFELDKILQSKREFRRRLAALPIVEKLAMLDALRERALAIRPPAFRVGSGIIARVISALPAETESVNPRAWN